MVAISLIRTGKADLKDDIMPLTQRTVEMITNDVRVFNFKDVQNKPNIKFLISFANY